MTQLPPQHIHLCVSKKSYVCVIPVLLDATTSLCQFNSCCSLPSPRAMMYTSLWCLYVGNQPMNINVMVNLYSNKAGRWFLSQTILGLIWLFQDIVLLKVTLDFYKQFWSVYLNAYRLHGLRYIIIKIYMIGQIGRICRESGKHKVKVCFGTYNNLKTRPSKVGGVGPSLGFH